MTVITICRQNLKGVNGTNFKLLAQRLQHKREVKVVTHGWMSSGKAQTCVEIKDNYLNMSDVDVFIMDWGSIAGKCRLNLMTL